MKNLLTLIVALQASTLIAQTDEFTSDGITFAILQDGQVEVKGAENQANEIVIPATVNYQGTDYTVTSIGDDAFNFSSFNSVTLPETITRIGNRAFSYCLFTSSINIPENVEWIGDEAFKRCFSTPLNLPTTIMHIGASAFWECTRISEVTFAEGIEIGENAFMYCTGVTKCEFEGTPAQIGACALAFTNLESLTMKCDTPPSFNPEDMFSYGDNETRDYPWTFDFDNVTLNVPAEAVDTYKTDRYWSIFANIKGIESETVSEFVFEGIEYSVLNNDTVEVSGLSEDLKNVVIPKEAEYGSKKYLVASIGANAFTNTAIETIKLSESVTTIGENAFNGCSMLKNVSFSEGLKTIGEKAFYACDSLKTISFPDGLEHIGMSAFHSCTSLAEVEFPTGINIADIAFLNSAVEKYVFRGMPEEIYYLSTKTLKEVHINVTEIPDFSPEQVFLYGTDYYNDKVVLFVPDEATVELLYGNETWDVFKQILPFGATYDADAPYIREKVVSTIKELKETKGIRAFVPEKNKLQFAGADYNSAYFWDGEYGLRIQNVASQSLSMKKWWDGFTAGCFIEGYFIGKMNMASFSQSSHEIEHSEEAEELKPLQVTGRMLQEAGEAGDARYLHAYIEMTGKSTIYGIETDDGIQISLYDIYGEELYVPDYADGETISVRGIYMGADEESTTIGETHRIMIPDPENCLKVGISTTTADEMPDNAIYDISGKYVGDNADALPEGIYIRDGKKILIKKQ